MIDNINQAQNIPIIPTPVAKNNTIPSKKNILIALGVLFLFIGLWRIFFKPATLTVIGEGKAEFTPTEVSMIVTRINTGSSAISTINEGNSGIEVLISTAKAIGGTTAEIEKIFYQVQPGVSADRSYQVANGFSLKFDDASRASEMIKNLYSDGASTVTSVSFSNDEKEVVEQIARKEAIKDAKEKAKRIAKSAGKRLGRIVTIGDDNKGIESSIINEARDDSALLSVSVTKNISVIYEIW